MYLLCWLTVSQQNVQYILKTPFARQSCMFQLNYVYKILHILSENPQIPQIKQEPNISVVLQSGVAIFMSRLLLQKLVIEDRGNLAIIVSQKPLLIPVQSFIELTQYYYYSVQGTSVRVWLEYEVGVNIVKLFIITNGKITSWSFVHTPDY